MQSSVVVANILMDLWFLLSTSFVPSLSPVHAPEAREQRLSSFAVQLPGQSETDAKDIASKYGFRFIDKVAIYVND